MTALETLLVGVDSACAGVLEPQFERGDLPTLRWLFDGASGPLESQIPPWTASAWPSLYTGTNPGKHGVFDFVTFDGYDYSIVSAADVDRPFLWELASQVDRTGVVVNAPVTHPPRPFDGALVPGYLAPDVPPCHPAGLLDDVDAAVGDYEVYGDPSAATDCVRSRGAAFRHLADRFDPAFGHVQFQWPDTICHERPGDREALADVYRAVDAEVGATIDACDPRNVVVVSDHGIGPYESPEFRVNELLAERGFVTTTTDGDGMPSWTRLRERGAETAGSGTDGTARAGSAERLAGVAASLGVTSQRLGAVLGAVGLDDLALWLAPKSVVTAATEQVDFPASRAYMRSRIECGVRVNLAGREPDGVVPASEYDAVREELIDLLADVTDPRGRPVFESVVPREEVVHGPHAERAVDLFTVPREFDYYLSASVGSGTFGEPTEPWNHKRTGVVAARGADVDESATLADAHLFDVAPTVLATMGLPADEAMDGRVLPFASPAGSRAYDDVTPVEGAAPSSVETRLSDLGYIE